MHHLRVVHDVLPVTVASHHIPSNFMRPGDVLFVVAVPNVVTVGQFPLIRSNKMQQMQVFIYCRIILHVSGVYRTHHQENFKL